MTMDSIKSDICRYFNRSTSFSVPFVKSPTTAAAPKGTYIAVKIDGVTQIGEMMQPNKNEGYHFNNAVNVVFIEVEGDGDVLRMVRNELQMAAFTAHANENGFSVWDIGQIIETPSYDGEFFVRQWRFTARMNFTDDVVSDVKKIATADVKFQVKV